jgi:type III secretion protein T
MASGIEAFALGSKEFFWVVGLAMARLSPIFQITPFLGGRHLTALTRNAMAMGLAVFLSPWMLARNPHGGVPDFGDVLPLLAKEVVLGTVFAVLSGFAFHAASGVGFLIDNQRGLSSAQMNDPMTGGETSPLGSMAMETLIMVFVATGGLGLFFPAVLTSYAFWPPFSYLPRFDAEALTAVLFAQFGWYMETMFVLAAPMLIVCFLVDLGMGLMNRFAPQLNVFFLAMPVKSALTMALLLVYWGAMFGYLGGEVTRLPVVWDALRHSFGLSA